MMLSILNFFMLRKFILIPQEYEVIVKKAKENVKNFCRP